VAAADSPRYLLGFPCLFTFGLSLVFGCFRRVALGVDRVDRFAPIVLYGIVSRLRPR